MTSRRHIGIEEARKVLGDLVTAAQQGNDIILTRNRRPAARIIPIKEDTMATQHTVTLVSAAPGDVVPGVELAELDGPLAVALTAHPAVQEFFNKVGYPDNPDELIYVVEQDDADEIVCAVVVDGEIVAGFDTLRVTISVTA